MRRAVLALLTTTMLAGGAIPASSGPPGSTRASIIFGEAVTSGARGGVAWNGSCRVVAAADPTGLQIPAGRYWAAEVGAVVAYHPATSLPADGTVFCYLRIDGVPVMPSDRVTTSGLLTAVRVPYVIEPHESIVEACAQVSFDGEPWFETTCGPTTSVQSPPQEVSEIVDALFVDNVDPLLCPALSSLAPGAPGIVIEDQGDSYVLGQRVYDCGTG